MSIPLMEVLPQLNLPIVVWGKIGMSPLGRDGDVSAVSKDEQRLTQPDSRDYKGKVLSLSDPVRVQEKLLPSVQKGNGMSRSGQIIDQVYPGPLKAPLYSNLGDIPGQVGGFAMSIDNRPGNTKASAGSGQMMFLKKSFNDIFKTGRLPAGIGLYHLWQRTFFPFQK